MTQAEQNFLSLQEAERERWNAWLRAHRIGLAAYVLSSLPAPGVYHEDDLCTQRFKAVKALLGGYLEEEYSSTSRWTIFLRSLPPSVLQLLARVLKEGGKVEKIKRDKFLPEIDVVLHELYPRRLGSGYEQGSLSPLGRAQTWAYHALLGQSSPRRLIRLGRAMFGERWRAIEKDAESIKKIFWPLKTLRNPWANTEEKCKAIAELAAVIWGSWFHPWWAQIEHILFSHQFYWPLLVSSPLDEEADLLPEIAIALPVAVDLNLNHQRASPTRPDRPDIIGTEGVLSVKSWSANLERAVRVAKELWRAKHGNHGDFRETVARARVQFDFRVAQMMTADLLVALGWSGFRLGGGSADAYFAQAVLHRFLGQAGSMASAVTGCIGDQLRDNEGRPLLNYTFIPPGGIAEKLQHAFACNRFERIVLPKGTEVEFATLLTSNEWVPKLQTAEVCYVEDLQNLSDVVQVRGWRQYQYIRCPDIMWAVHSAHRGRVGLLDATDSRVQHIVRILSSNQVPMIELSDISLVALGSALWHINSYMREGIRPRPPSSLSWAFIRILDEQYETRFWQLLWRTIGAPADEFQSFIEHPSREEAVDRLAKALNRFAPDEDHPYRAPDILVLIGTEYFKDSEKQTFNPQSRPFMVSAVLKELSNRLLGPYDNRFLSLVGRTRVILLPTDEPGADEKETSLKVLPPKQLPLLQSLATFEWGFTQHTASLMLVPEFGEEYDGAMLREKILKPLVEKDVLREGQGWYHIPRSIIKELRSEEDPQTLAQRHYRAGCALAPYVVGSEFPALALDTAFNPEHVHEAEWHFRLAIRHARRAGDMQCQNASNAALRHLTRFAEIPRWGVVLSLLQAGNLSQEAYDMAAELLEWQRTAKVTSHPNHLLLMARTAAQWAKQNGEKSSNPALGQRLRQEAEAYFRQALDYCAAFPSEEEFNRVVVLTSYALHLAEQAPDREEDFKCLSEQALDLLYKSNNPPNPKAAQGGWYELLGDREPDHAKASSFYGLGIKAGLEWAQLWIKGLGAASLADMPKDVNVIRKILSADKMVEFLARIRSAYQRQRQTSPEHVTWRWEEGFRMCQIFWGSHPRMRSALGALQPMKR